MLYWGSVLAVHCGVTQAPTPRLSHLNDFYMKTGREVWGVRCEGGPCTLLPCDHSQHQPHKGAPLHCQSDNEWRCSNLNLDKKRVRREERSSVSLNLRPASRLNLLNSSNLITTKRIPKSPPYQASSKETSATTRLQVIIFSVYRIKNAWCVDDGHISKLR